MKKEYFKDLLESVDQARKIHRGKIIKKPWGHEEIIHSKDKVTFKFIHIRKGEITPIMNHTDTDKAILAMDDNLFINLGGGAWKMEKNKIQPIFPKHEHRFAAIGGDTIIAELSYNGKKRCLSSAGRAPVL